MKGKIIERKRIGIDKWVCKSQKNEGTYETINYWTEVVKSVLPAILSRDGD